VRVLDLTRVLAGPTCARTLAEHGADVLHVRSPALPSIEPFVVDTNVGKRSCHLDLDDPEDAPVARAGARRRRLRQGYRPGALARRGCSPTELAALRPGIIVAALSCYGHDGPWSERPGWEQLAQTVSGMAHEHGATPPAVIPAAITDYTTGYWRARGAVRPGPTRRGRGSWLVQVSLTRTAMWLLSLPRVEGDAPRRAWIARRSPRGGSPWTAPGGSCADSGRSPACRPRRLDGTCHRPGWAAIRRPGTAGFRCVDLSGDAV
jgi:crotonobetainyl-CoA:carnitine CoA-transferase CaiB-like acyl-CoA transferase